MSLIAPTMLWFSRREYRLIVILYLEHSVERIRRAGGRSNSKHNNARSSE